MILVLTLVLFGVTMAVMAVGLLAGKRLRGSCGGSQGACDCADAATCPRVKGLSRVAPPAEKAFRPR